MSWSFTIPLDNKTIVFNCATSNIRKQTMQLFSRRTRAVLGGWNWDRVDTVNIDVGRAGGVVFSRKTVGITISEPIDVESIEFALITAGEVTHG